MTAGNGDSFAPLTDNSYCLESETDAEDDGDE